MKRFKIDLILTAILVAMTITFGALAQKFAIGSAGYHTLSAFAVLGCLVLFVMCIKLMMDIVIAWGEVRERNE